MLAILAVRFRASRLGRGVWTCGAFGRRRPAGGGAAQDQSAFRDDLGELRLRVFLRHRRVVEEGAHQVVDLRRGVGADELVGAFDHVALGKDFQPLLHAVVRGRQVDVTAHRQRALLRLKATCVAGAIIVDASTSCAADFSGSDRTGK